MIFEKNRLQIVVTPDLLGSPGLILVYDQFIGLGTNLQGSSAVIDFTAMGPLMPSLRLPWDKGFSYGDKRNSRGYMHTFERTYPTYLRSSMNVGLRDSIPAELYGNYPDDFRQAEELYMTNMYKKFYGSTAIKNWQTDSLISGGKTKDVPVLMFLTSYLDSAWVQELDGAIMKQWMAPYQIDALEKEIDGLSSAEFRRKSTNDGTEGNEEYPKFVDWAEIGLAQDKPKSIELQAASVSNYLKALNYFLKTTNE